MVIEAVSDRRQEDGAADKLNLYAALGISQFWVIRGDSDEEPADGMVAIFHLHQGCYVGTGSRLLSRLR